MADAIARRLVAVVSTSRIPAQGLRSWVRRGRLLELIRNDNTGVPRVRRDDVRERRSSSIGKRIASADWINQCIGNACNLQTKRHIRSVGPTANSNACLTTSRNLPKTIGATVVGCIDS